MTQNQTSGGYNWLDGWGNYYLNFDDGGQDNGEGCVAMKSNGKWNDTVCTDSHVSVCKKTDRKCENLLCKRTDREVKTMPGGLTKIIILSNQYICVENPDCRCIQVTAMLMILIP